MKQLVPLLLLVAGLTACGGGGEAEPTATAATTAAAATHSTPWPAAALPTIIPDTTASPVPAVASAAAATASPAASEADQAVAAAAAIFGGVVDAACTPSAETPVCITPNPSLGTPQRGTAAFATSDYPGSGAMEFLGQTPEGEWKFWFGTQNITYQLTVLPGDMRVCAGGAGLNVRASPAVGSEALTLLKDDTIVTADRFVLTESGSRSPTTGAQAGFGWYYLTSPDEGWAASKYLSAASLGDCSVHDALVRD